MRTHVRTAREWELYYERRVLLHKRARGGGTETISIKHTARSQSWKGSDESRGERRMRSSRLLCRIGLRLAQRPYLTQPHLRQYSTDRVTETPTRQLNEESPPETDGSPGREDVSRRGRWWAFEVKRGGGGAIQTTSARSNLLSRAQSPLQLSSVC